MAASLSVLLDRANRDSAMALCLLDPTASIESRIPYAAQAFANYSDVYRWTAISVLVVERTELARIHHRVVIGRVDAHPLG